MDLAFLKHITKVQMADKLSRTMSTSSRTLNRFTASEVSYMISTEGQYTAEELSKKLPHPIGSIRDKAYRLDLSLKLNKSGRKPKVAVYEGT